MVIKGADIIVKGIPPLNGRYLTCGDLFNLYCYDMGKPHALLCYYQSNHMVDYLAYLWLMEQGSSPTLDIPLDAC